MAGEELLKLFDQNWSERSIFKKRKDPLNLNEKDSKKRGESEIPEEEATKNFPVNDLLSPRSVLTVKSTSMKLQTILSGKEVREFSSAERERIWVLFSRRKTIKTQIWSRFFLDYRDW
ncbi:unnamed protein product [Arabis nemorensis]|uniref:Uncharacterized protein n=1 Tax=Arabis nemorensis TaxID=586526 RepID=A0A565BNJ8_9BRAS|nr:unnamed protein product [Arabis nemorensis]